MSDEQRPGCVVCARDLSATELQTHERCIGRVRADLFAIVDAYRLLPETLGHLSSNAPRDRSRSSERPLPGGEALAMLANGSPAKARLRAYLSLDRKERARYGFDRLESELDQDDQPSDPLSVAYELGRWEDDWRIVRSEPAAEYLMAVETASVYLNRNMGWAGQWHFAFDEFASDLRGMRYRLEAVCGTSNRSVRAAVSCFDCGDDALERQYGDQGLDDDWTCRTCGRIYDQASYWLAVRAKLQDQQDTACA